MMLVNDRNLNDGVFIAIFVYLGVLKKYGLWWFVNKPSGAGPSGLPNHLTKRAGWVFMVLLPEASIGLRVLSLPESVRPSVSPSVAKFVRMINHHPFKLGSPNLDHRCKSPCLRSLLFCDLDLQGQI